jgi:tRNA (guanine-N7-)-methyltransferase
MRTPSSSSDPVSIGRLYGRRKGHKLRTAQQALVETLLPQVAVPDTGLLSAQTLFGDDRPMGLEIGFGAGEHLAWQATQHSDMGLIGCEPFLNGVVGALGHLRDQALGNVRLYMGDALDVLARLPDASLSHVWLLHPDPWPKARHAKRRLMNRGPLDLIAAKLKPGGEFRFGTDHPIYVCHALMVMDQRRDFAWQAAHPDDFNRRPADWPETRYAHKARTVYGHELWYFRWRRI